MIRSKANITNRLRKGVPIYKNEPFFIDSNFSDIPMV